MAVQGQPDPILRVTVGSPVYTRDHHKVGTVKERRRNAFKVATPFLQRDYWIEADSVALATPDGAVYLMFDKVELKDRRRGEPPSD